MHILLIDDYKTISQIIAPSLSAYGYTVTKRDSNFLVEQVSDVTKYPLTIINTNMKNNNVFKLVRNIKHLINHPYVIGITTLQAWKHTVRFLNAGGDDILRFPFPFQELLARIQALQRRPRKYFNNVVYFDGYKVDFINRQIWYKGKPFHLRKKEFQILEYIIRNKNRPISRSEFMDNIWDYNRMMSSNTIDVHVNKLRRRLQSVKKPPAIKIKTVHGFGYMLKEPSHGYIREAGASYDESNKKK